MILIEGLPKISEKQQSQAESSSPEKDSSPSKLRRDASDKKRTRDEFEKDFDSPWKTSKKEFNSDFDVSDDSLLDAIVEKNSDNEKQSSEEVAPTKRETRGRRIKLNFYQEESDGEEKSQSDDSEFVVE